MKIEPTYEKNHWKTIKNWIKILTKKCIKMLKSNQKLPENEKHVEIDLKHEKNRLNLLKIHPKSGKKY